MCTSRCTTTSNDFQRNEGSNKDLSSLYTESAESRNKVHHGFVEDYELGRVLVILWDDLTDNEKKLFHMSKVTLSPKTWSLFGWHLRQLQQSDQKDPVSQRDNRH